MTTHAGTGHPDATPRTDAETTAVKRVRDYTCAECRCEMHHSTRSPVCLTCRSSRTCQGCGTPVSYRSTGMCRACANAAIRSRPDFVEKQRAGIRRFNTDPRHAEARKLKAQKAARTKMADPASVAKLREVGRLYGKPNLAFTRSPEQRARAGQTRTATVLAWCPPEWRDRYRYLKDTKLLRAAEAKAMILDEMAADERRRVAALTPTERMLERARKHGIVAKPVLRRADHAFTLGGIASGIDA